MATYYVGWDVGAWYCDGNPNSRDAIVVFDNKGVPHCSHRKVVRKELQKTEIHEFLNVYFENAEQKPKNKFKKEDKFIFAIDAVFSLPFGYLTLLSGKNPFFDKIVWEHGKSLENPLLFRYTERFVKEQTGTRAFSVIQDQIGSQSTKIIYFLNHFHLCQRNSIGVWESDDLKITAIETYPSIIGKKGTDIEDATLCACLARDFAEDREKKELHYPIPKMYEIIKKEGWIWFRKKNE